MYHCSVEFDGIVYRNAEAAFQARKAPVSEREKFALLDGRKAKKLGGKNGPYAMKCGSGELENWNRNSLNIMEMVVRTKFTQNADLAQRLIETGDDRIIEGNNYFDNLYGIPLLIEEGNRKKPVRDENGYYILAEPETEANNHLGKILMKIREELKEKRRS